MLTVEALIVAIWVASIAALIGGAVGVMREWAKASTPRPDPLPAYRGGHRAARPRRLARSMAAFAAGWRDLAHAHALLRGDLDAA